MESEELTMHTQDASSSSAFEEHAVIWSKATPPPDLSNYEDIQRKQTACDVIGSSSLLLMHAFAADQVSF
jgi:hypothetical protein